MGNIPNITMNNCVAEGNSGDGIRIEGNLSVAMNGVVTRNNGGQGVNIVQPKNNAKSSIVRDLGTNIVASVAANVISQKIQGR